MSDTTMKIQTTTQLQWLEKIQYWFKGSDDQEMVEAVLESLKRLTILEEKLPKIKEGQADIYQLFDKVEQRIDTLKASDVLQQPDANVVVNAPLALMQVGQKERIAELQTIRALINEVILPF